MLANIARNCSGVLRSKRCQSNNWLPFTCEVCTSSNACVSLFYRRWPKWKSSHSLFFCH